MIDAGKLNKRITIERIESTTKGTTNQDMPNWGPLVTIWAQIKTLSGKEGKQANQIKAIADYEITIRHTDVTVRDRIDFDGQRMDISSINRDDDFDLVIQASGRVVYCQLHHQLPSSFF